MPTALCRLCVVLAIMAVAATLAPARAASVTLSCSGLGVEFQLCESGAQAWAQATGHTVKVVATPADANERLALYQTLLAAGSPDIDVFQIDVVWPGILGRHFIDLGAALPDEARADQFPALMANNTVEGRLVAMPWFVDAGLLYYRKDLLERHGRSVPRTWSDLEETARAIIEAERAGGNATLQGFVWQGRAYEGLTCNALEWIASFGGGGLVDETGEITVDNPRAAAALAMAAGWVGTISPEGVLAYGEEEARGVFQSGNAVFMRNWPYAWALANAPDSPVAGKVGVAPPPKGAGAQGVHAATLGGQQLAVSRYSAEPEAAADLVRHLTGAAEQKRRALEGSFNPTRPSLYADADLLAANPFLADFAEVLEQAVARPSTVTGRHYNRVSSAFFGAVHSALAGETPPGQALSTLTRRLERMKRW